MCLYGVCVLPLSHFPPCSFTLPWQQVRKTPKYTERSIVFFWNIFEKYVARFNHIYFNKYFKFDEYLAQLLYFWKNDIFGDGRKSRAVAWDRKCFDRLGLGVGFVYFPRVGFICRPIAWFYLSAVLKVSTEFICSVVGISFVHAVLIAESRRHLQKSVWK